MANEITVAVSISCSNGGATIASGTLSKSLTQVGTDMAAITMSVPTTSGGTELTKPAALTAIGHFCLKNLDTSNYIELSSANSTGFAAGRFAKVQPGGVILLEVTQITTIYAMANTDAVSVQYWMVEA